MYEFKHEKYTWSNSFGRYRHKWELVCSEGGLDFHVTIGEADIVYAGLEFHHISGEGAPDHVNCPLTGGRCWHDGTSLYAIESVWPRIEQLLKLGDHETTFKILEMEARLHFKNEEEE